MAMVSMECANTIVVQVIPGWLRTLLAGALLSFDGADVMAMYFNGAVVPDSPCTDAALERHGCSPAEGVSAWYDVGACSPAAWQLAS
ncbi:hypothetical protein [Lacisediminimonas sp.]|uniref:hypothetical protein n=1 Tax=Lacisediminimonas sp. TaxID=3060582 RepID=UPI00272D1816|nr:hypothetical protein [Lacisediminimonas sp.]